MNYVPVLTRMHEGLFVVGGDDPVTGLPTGEAWFTSLASRTWDRVPLGFDLGRTLAATYLYSADALFVLDESTEGDLGFWEVTLADHNAQLIGTWPRREVWDRHWLVADRDGHALLVTSRSTALPSHEASKGGNKQELCHYPPGHPEGAHTVAVAAPAVPAHLAHGDSMGPCAGYAIIVLDVLTGGEVTVEGIETGTRALLAAPLVDRDGYTTLQQAGPDSTEVVRVREPALELREARFEEIGSYL